MEEIKIIKTSEKILIWMHRQRITQSYVASKIGITRQALSQKMTDNIFSVRDIQVIKQLGCPL